MTPIEILTAAALFALGTVMLILGGNWFVDGAAGIARRLRMPEVLIGATVVSIGTTLPEVMVSASAAVSGHGEIAYGNAIGSILCNTGLIAAVTMAFRPYSVEKGGMKMPVLFFFIAAAFCAFNAYAFGQFSRLTGILLLGVFAVYIFLSVRKTGQGMALAAEPAPEEAGAEEEVPLWLDLLRLAGGAVLIAFGANFLVDNGTLLAQAMGVPESVIALTFVALGTSLPELVTAVISIRKGHGALTLGNVIGANLFNLVLVVGVSATLSPYRIPVGKTLFGMNAAMLVDLPLVFLAMGLLTLPTLKRGKTSRPQGIILLALYAAYCVFEFFL
ncbi:MAG: calcium/sodium antiporter [Lachnospiraceae bacterium]|nr:calcium/sodium antiporter [Lachnospiraceae bacterium]